jgi:hypothetical protein
MVRHLQKRRNSSRSGGTKYYVNCSKYAKNSEDIHIETVVKTISHTAILKAFLEYETIQKKHKHIVVKIGKNE